jgi:hypothetical protein
MYVYVFITSRPSLLIVFTCQAHFNIYSNPKPGQPWGTFTMDHNVPRELGPVYDFDEIDDRARPPASKISKHNGTWDAVLLARLRFKTDASEPTSR